MVTIVNNTVLFFWKLLIQLILKVLIIRKNVYLWEVMDVNQICVVAIISQYVHVSNHYIVHLKQIQYDR